MRLATTFLLALISALGVQFPAAAQLTSHQTTNADLSGTWVVDIAKSNFGMIPPASFDTIRVARAGAVNRIDQVTDFGGEGIQQPSYNWPIGDGETTNDMPGGMIMHSTLKQKADTSTLLNERRSRFSPSFIT